MISKISRFITLFFIAATLNAQAAPIPPASSAPTIKTVSETSAGVPSRTIQLFFNNAQQQRGNVTLGNFSAGDKIEFNLRHDELASQATLHLQYVPSPALIPVQSQLKVYFNDQLIQVITVTTDQLAKVNTADIPIPARDISDFNRLRLEFIGHYNAACENPANSAVWMDIDKQSYLELTLQTLPVKDDLSHFPKPFFDALDARVLNLPIVFAGTPDLLQQRAAAVLASWFGTKALWRGATFSALFNQLPTSNAVVLATNSQRPDFLKNYKTVNAPTIEMISHPNNPYVKLLLILGRDDKDLLTAIEGITQGSVLFRGRSIIVDNVKMLAPRKPYDAPNWIRTDGPVTFAQLQQFAEQLQTSGFKPYPISLRFNLPPDLFLNQTRGIDLRLKYNYSPPPKASMSHMDVVLNNYFIKSYSIDEHLVSSQNILRSKNASQIEEKLYIPVLDLGVNNELEFDFEYGTQVAGGAQNGTCANFVVVNNYGSVDPSSTIDFSNYLHYIAMPNLAAFAKSGYPFSRLADLSQTTIFINQQTSPESVSTLLNTMGAIGSQTGYPAVAVTLTDDWSQVKNQDKDIMILGTFPEELLDYDKLNLLINKTHDWIKYPLNSNIMPDSSLTNTLSPAGSKITVDATDTMAAIIGVQSPYFKERSIVALLADSPTGFELVSNALIQKQNLLNIFGSVAIIRDSGVSSLRVGDIYHLGRLPWWVGFWFTLQQHPINLAIISLLAAILVTFLLWNGLNRVSRNRLKAAEQDKK